MWSRCRGGRTYLAAGDRLANEKGRQRYRASGFCISWRIATARPFNGTGLPLIARCVFLRVHTVLQAFD
jgi:hypothetical protein